MKLRRLLEILLKCAEAGQKKKAMNVAAMKHMSEAQVDRMMFFGPLWDRVGTGDFDET